MKRRKKKALLSSSLRSSRGVRMRRCWPGFRSRSSLSGARACSFLVSLVQRSRSVPFVCRQAHAARHHGWYGPERQYSSCARRRLGQWLMRGWFYWSCTSCCVPLRCRQAQDACHHGRYGPEGALRGAVQTTADFPQLQFIAGRRFPCRGAEADSHGPDCSADHRNSSVSPVHGGRCLWFAGRADFPVVAQRLVPWSGLFVGPSRFPSCSLTRWPMSMLCLSCKFYRSRASCTGRHHPCRGAEADLHGLVDHGDSA